MAAEPQLLEPGELRRTLHDAIATPVPRLKEALEAIAPNQGLLFGRFDYRTGLRKTAAEVIGKERATYLSLRDFRRHAITDLADCAQGVGAVAAVSGHRDLQTVSR